MAYIRRGEETVSGSLSVGPLYTESVAVTFCSCQLWAKVNATDVNAISAAQQNHNIFSLSSEKIFFVLFCFFLNSGDFLPHLQYMV